MKLPSRRAQGIAGGVFTGFVATLIVVLNVWGPKARWSAHWTSAYRVVVEHPIRLEEVESAYQSVADACQPLPTSITRGLCKEPHVTGVVCWTEGILSDPHLQDSVRTHWDDDGSMLSARVILHPMRVLGTARHAAWHTIGALHPQRPPKGHVLHPGSREEWDGWGYSTRAYSACED